MSGWQIAAVVVAGIVAFDVTLAVLLTLAGRRRDAYAAGFADGRAYERFEASATICPECEEGGGLHHADCSRRRRLTRVL